MGHEKDSSRLRHELERVRERLTQIANEQIELEGRIAGLEAEDQGLSERRDTALHAVAELERAQLDLTSALAGERDRLEGLAAILTEARVRSAQLGEKRASLVAATLRLAAARGDHEARVARLGSEIEEAQARIAALNLDTERLASELEAFRQERLGTAQQLAEGRAAYDQRGAALAEVELSVRALRTTAEKLASSLASLELRRNQVAMNQKVLDESILDRYQLMLESIVVDYHQRPIISEIEEKRLGELRDLIERMGTDINLTAIEEYAEVSTRFEFLSAQRADLDRAVDQLQKAIDKINKTSRRLFKETFNSVNATFKEVFPRLFRGGQAALSLTGGEGRRPPRGRHRDHGAAARQEEQHRRAAVRRREGAHRGRAGLLHLPHQALAVLHPRRGRRTARRGQRRSLQRAGARDDRSFAVHRHHPQQAHHGVRRQPLRRHHAGAGRVEAGDGEPLSSRSEGRRCIGYEDRRHRWSAGGR